MREPVYVDVNVDRRTGVSYTVFISLVDVDVLLPVQGLLTKNTATNVYTNRNAINPMVSVSMRLVVNVRFPSSSYSSSIMN
jgi:hypothetical protein